MCLSLVSRCVLSGEVGSVCARRDEQTVSNRGRAVGARQERAEILLAHGGLLDLQDVDVDVCAGNFREGGDLGFVLRHHTKRCEGCQTQADQCGKYFHLYLLCSIRDYYALFCIFVKGCL